MLASTLMGMVIKNVDMERKSTAMGVYQSIYGIGMTLGPILMGFLVQYTSKLSSFLCMTLISLACMVFTIVSYQSVFGVAVEKKLDKKSRCRQPKQKVEDRSDNIMLKQEK